MSQWKPLDIPEEELLIPTTSLYAIGEIVGKSCDKTNYNFAKCKHEKKRPDFCLEEGKEVTLCAKRV
jgi:hypothetical protein